MFKYIKLLLLQIFIIKSILPIKLIYQSKEIDISNKILAEAKQKKDYLNNLKHFNQKYNKDPKWQDSALKDEKIKKIKLQTKDNIKFKAYLIDRGSDKVIVVGQGFLSDKEVLVPFLKLFPDYDILIFDYRWKNWHQKSIVKRLDSFFNTLKKYIYDAKNEVCAVVKHLRTSCHYKSITGIGQCYSGLIFTIAQVTKLERRKELLFDNLIIDSGFFSTKALMKRILDDPKLCWENKNGGAPRLIRYLTGNFATYLVFATLGRIWLGEDFSKLSMDTYLPYLKNTKLMFIHGEKDLLIPYSDFENMYNNATNTQRCALITPSTHTSNHLEDKENYSYFVDRFIQANSVADFVKEITLS